ncbi:MAG: cytochrome c3 family protein [Planctomycetota bacterium]|jgi:predicted CXXCH cytochrome family protein
MRKKILVASTSLLLILFAGVAAVGLDWSGSSGKTQCFDCHVTHNATGSPLIGSPYANVNALCRSCHDNGGPGPEADTHITTTYKCTRCHEPHNSQGNFKHIRTTITTPNSGDRTVSYTTSEGTELVNSSHTGVCQVCHTTTTYYTNTSSWPDSHNNGADCRNCHDHAAGFPGAGGGCTGCHGSEQGSGSYGNNKRRIIVGSTGDFDQRTGSRMGGHFDGGSGNADPTDFECMVCHAEGEIQSGSVVTTSLHQNQQIDLYNVDSPSGAKFVVKTFPGGSGWDSSSPDYQNNLTEFCLRCHDSDGASSHFTSNTSPLSGTPGASNPFGDGNSPMDLIARFQVSNYSSHAINSSRGGLGAKYSADWPTDGNAMDGNSFVSGWGSASTTECSDCHLGQDTAGTPTYYHNAHGSRNLGWLVTDKNGMDQAVTPTNRSYETSTSTVICYKCHLPGTYSGDGTTTQEGYSRMPDHNQKGNHHAPAGNKSGNIFLIGCLNCHGGYNAGGIHGSNDQITDDGSLGTYNAYRFSNGAAMDYFISASGNNNSTCSAKQTTGPTSTHCTQHGTKNYTRNYN